MLAQPTNAALGPYRLHLFQKGSSLTGYNGASWRLLRVPTISLPVGARTPDLRDNRVVAAAENRERALRLELANPRRSKP